MPSRSPSLRQLAVVGLALLLGGSVVSAQSQSPAIGDVVLDWTTHDRRAPGSDNWPITWSDDDHQYTSWGDGGGFGGDNSNGRVGLGFARVEGSPASHQGFNVWGGLNGENFATFGGKSYGIISIGGVLYSWWGPGSGTQSYAETRLLVSTNKGATWTQSTWNLVGVDAGLIMPTILNFGKDYAGARDSFVYHYFIRKEPIGSGLSIHKGGNPATGKIDLARVPANDMMNLSAYEYFAGLDGGGNPTWSANAAQRVPVFEDPNGVGWNVSVSYNAGLGRYILMTEHTQTFAGLLGMFDAPEPWGPWTTVLYHDSSGFGAGQIELSTFFWNFSNKWLSADGLDFTLVFTGIGSNDSWNTVRGSFVPADDTPPSIPQNLAASAQSENRIDLTWSPSVDAESGVSHYVVYRDGAAVGQAAATSYADTTVIESATYSYRVAAVNGSGVESGQSAEASATTPADTTPPSIVSATAEGNPGQVVVIFSESIEAATATTSANYAVSNGITVNSASLGSDLRTVTLQTSSHSTGVTYTLTVNNVRDRAATPNTIIAGSSASYVFNAEVVISNLTASSGRSYQVGDNLGVGSSAYIDRNYTYAAIPGYLAGAKHIRTANDDKNLSGDTFLSFDVNQAVTVYVAHDDGYTTKPAWLNQFSDSGDGLTIATTTDAPFSLYRRDFVAGTIVLGGNIASGDPTDRSMYTVVVVAASVPTEPPAPPTGIETK